MHSWRPKLRPSAATPAAGPDCRPGAAPARESRSSRSRDTAGGTAGTPSGLPSAPVPSPVSRTTYGRAGDVGVELAVGPKAVARPAGHVAQLDVDRLPRALRPGGVRLQRAERPVAVVEQHADGAAPAARSRCPCRCARRGHRGRQSRAHPAARRRRAEVTAARPRALRPAPPRGAPPASSGIDARRGTRCADVTPIRQGQPTSSSPDEIGGALRRFTAIPRKERP